LAWKYYLIIPHKGKWNIWYRFMAEVFVL
jgi:hypothetical protein